MSTTRSNEQSNMAGSIGGFKDHIVIDRKLCQWASALVVLLMAGNVYCLMTLYSAVFAENNICSSQKQVVAPGPVAGPYSTAIAANGFLFISGQIAVINGVVEGTVEEQAEHALKNIQNILADFGSNMNKVVKCTACDQSIKCILWLPSTTKPVNVSPKRNAHTQYRSS